MRRNQKLLPRLPSIDMAGDPEWGQAIFVDGLKSTPVRYQFKS